MSEHRKYGWIPDLPDVRDHVYKLPQKMRISSLPKSVDLRPNCPPVLHQGKLGSCTANAVCTAHMFSQMKQKSKTPMSPSRLFLYYNTRWIEGTTYVDCGSQIRNSIKVIANKGVCSESLWPYLEDKFKVRPTTPCFKEAKKFQSLKYERLNNSNLSALKGCLASGYPFVFGFTVYDSFEGERIANTGTVYMPDFGVEGVVGGHAVLAVGYDDSTQRFTVMNSWGESWGNRGFFTIPYKYLINPYLADDFWTIRTVETGL